MAFCAIRIIFSHIYIYLFILFVFFVSPLWFSAFQLELHMNTDLFRLRQRQVVVIQYVTPQTLR